MAIETKEITFEREIEYSLLDHGGYIKGNPRDYNREFAIDTKLLFRFLQESQPAEWAKLCKKHGDDVETGFLKKLYRDLDTHGMILISKSARRLQMILAMKRARQTRLWANS